MVYICEKKKHLHVHVTLSDIYCMLIPAGCEELENFILP